MLYDLFNLYSALQSITKQYHSFTYLENKPVHVFSQKINSSLYKVNNT